MSSVIEQAQSALKVVTWNVEWAPPQSSRGRMIRSILEEAEADVICLTEGRAENLPADGQVIESDPDYGYPLKAGRRKVLLWTRHSWSAIDSIGHADLPPGRFVSAVLEWTSRPIRFVGVCIPWSAAHVSSGRQDRARWEDHLAYLGALPQFLDECESLSKVVLGDFNQAVPRNRQPQKVYAALERAFTASKYELLTAAEIAEDGLPLIDHVAICGGLGGRIESTLSKTTGGIRLSDHAGVVASVWHHDTADAQEFGQA